MYKNCQSNYKPCTHTGIQSPILSPPLPPWINSMPMWSSTQWRKSSFCFPDSWFNWRYVSSWQCIQCFSFSLCFVSLFDTRWRFWWMWAAKSKLDWWVHQGRGICGGNDIISNHMPCHQSEPCFWDSNFLFRSSVQMRKALSARHGNRRD